MKFSKKIELDVCQKSVALGLTLACVVAALAFKHLRQ